ncbi:MAG: zf-HC2 domain-containing protein [Anaeromyxobacter sp.]
MTALLGGPGLPCSSLRLRQLEAGELAGEARERAEAHLADCARCQATRASFAEEQAELERSLPFDRFAAGVASRLAARAARPARRLPRWAPLAAAAALALGLAVPLLGRAPAVGPLHRAKGSAGPEVALFALRAGQVSALGPDEAVPAGAALRVGLARAARSSAAVALLDADGAALLYAGPARTGPLTEAFEWTGGGEGTLVVVLDDRPVDGAALVARLQAGGPGAAASSPGATVVLRPLRREGR